MASQDSLEDSKNQETFDSSTPIGMPGTLADLAAATAAMDMTTGSRTLLSSPVVYSKIIFLFHFVCKRYGCRHVARRFSGRIKNSS